MLLDKVGYFGTNYSYCDRNYPGGLCWLDARKPDLAAEIVEFAQFYMKQSF
ncbi:hypothetical protein [Nostoc sp. CHAB 5715]|uniref:hypothetical protein n=1 Tax=Nostoc sp. CHAB 5715 TaxID=2780400 RepID=UPI001E5909CE|nr:hypothetical protein [Nostoc sp. CHAB 5715]MCC5622473.1 hypothetical protein [Nostoc sp. CHAB 5715]